ncbi:MULTISPECIES: hypothetical protein [Flavobacteriaceae]|uniref:hypothetical protein n=1 Tax=Flavobacteriaceae TaxID=49546 RepID=UPI0010AE8C4B|nr:MULTISPECIES: hypothetical protein [Flavobacteriaceae]NJB38094.1 hypothetical protein [Croceivirga sp. JEA036]TKD59007.1 hypothetical protein FBT53_14580 [Flavobacterium sp. ASW18X]
MKQIRLISLVSLLVLPVLAHAQFAVVDATANAQLVKANIQLVKVNSQLMAHNKLLTQMVKNQQVLLDLIRQQNKILAHTDQLKTEEIETYKKAPASVIVDYQLRDLEQVKENMIQAARDFVDFLGAVEHLKPSDYEVYNDRVVGIVENTVSAWKQTKQLLASNDKIIPAGERQELLKLTIENISSNISKIRSYQEQLKMLNDNRKTANRFFGEN